MSTSSTPGNTRKSSRLAKPNPLFSPQPGFTKTNGARERAASTSSSEQPAWGKLLEGRVKQMEEQVINIEAENIRLKEEVTRLRGKLEEEEARRQMEEKLRVVVEVDEREREKIKTEMEREKEERKRREDQKTKEVKDEIKKDMEQGLKEVEERLATTTTKTKTSPGKPEESEGEEKVEDDDDDTDQVYKCVVITDSNGKDITQESIRNHMPTNKRAKYEISVVVAYRLEDAYERIKKGHVNVDNAYVVIDNITNNLRGGKNHAPESPELVMNRVAVLREFILARAAKAVVVCELKPMRRVDVRLASLMIHNYLVSCGKAGYGCHTQIRMSFLKDDGFHVQPKHLSILDKTYACALLGIHVPDPTPFNDLTPESVRRSWEIQWPRMGGKGNPKS